MNIKPVYIVLLLIAGALGCYYFGYRSGSARIITNTIRDTTTITKYRDTTYTITKWYPKHDTVYVNSSDTMQYPIAVETLDTLLTNGRDSVGLNIKRFAYKEPYYSLAFRLNRRDSIQIIRETNNLEKPDSWIDRFSIGIGPGLSLFKDGDNIKAAPSLNLSLYYKLY